MASRLNRLERNRSPALTLRRQKGSRSYRYRIGKMTFFEAPPPLFDRLVGRHAKSIISPSVFRRKDATARTALFKERGKRRSVGVFSNTAIRDKHLRFHELLHLLHVSSLYPIRLRGDGKLAEFGELLIKIIESNQSFNRMKRAPSRPLEEEIRTAKHIPFILVHLAQAFENRRALREAITALFESQSMRAHLTRLNRSKGDKELDQNDRRSIHQIMQFLLKQSHKRFRQFFRH